MSARAISHDRRGGGGHQRGIALVTSMLLLVIITIIALSMFRSFAVQEHIAGNVREKERALHAAETAQQYGEWWLTQANNAAIGSTPCAAGSLNANATEGEICQQTLVQQGYTVTNVPWPIQTLYVPPGMSITPGVNGQSGDPPYALPPGYYITDLGPAGDGQGEAYQIDAYGVGSTPTTMILGGNSATVANATVAVVESTYEVQQGVVNKGGL